MDDQTTRLWERTVIRTEDFPEVSTEQMRARYNFINGSTNSSTQERHAVERAEVVRLMLELMRRDD